MWTGNCKIGIKENRLTVWFIGVIMLVNLRTEVVMTEFAGIYVEAILGLHHAHQVSLGWQHIQDVNCTVQILQCVYMEKERTTTYLLKHHICSDILGPWSIFTKSYNVILRWDSSGIPSEFLKSWHFSPPGYQKIPTFSPAGIPLGFRKSRHFFPVGSRHFPDGIPTFSRWNSGKSRHFFPVGSHLYFLWGM
jgi:hypothetical protein